MMILANEEMADAYDFFSAIPENIRRIVQLSDTDKLMEIRLRNGCPVVFVRTDGVFYLSPKGKLTTQYSKAVFVTTHDIRRGLELITHSSVYAFENEIRNGYITLSGGHRVGICGDAVTQNGEISHLKEVQALNYRFAREVVGCADKVIDKIFDGRVIYNTIIVSPPMRGKTTMLRDIARQLSLAGKKVSIVDERGEIAAISGGISPFDLGAGCDVLSNVNKAEGMLLMLRSMSPDVIMTDEIGGEKDINAIREIKKRGVSIITSIHGEEAPTDDFDKVIHLKGLGICSS